MIFNNNFRNWCECKLGYFLQVDFQKLKIYYMDEFPGFLFQPETEIKAAVRKVIVEIFNHMYNNIHR